MMQGGEITELAWKIRVNSPSINWAVITAESAKGGVEKLLVAIIALPNQVKVYFLPLPP